MDIREMTNAQIYQLIENCSNNIEKQLNTIQECNNELVKRHNNHCSKISKSLKGTPKQKVEQKHKEMYSRIIQMKKENTPVNDIIKTLGISQSTYYVIINKFTTRKQSSLLGGNKR